MATQLTTAEQAQVPALTAEGERFALRQRQARMFASSPLVPEHLRKGSPEQAIANCWIALTLAEAMGEVPLIVMQNIHVVSGKAGFASQYMIARANSSGIFKGRIDWRIDRSDPANLAVTAYAVIKDSGQQVEVTCDMAMAKAEGWTKNSKYSTMPEVMLRYRSAAFLVRFYAPDVMLGYQTADEIEDVTLAAGPAAEPLTSKMLIDQSKAPDLSATPARVDEPDHDPETGEIIDEQPIEEAQADAIEAEVEEGPDPRIAAADAIIAEIEEQGAEIDINAILSRETETIAAMPVEMESRIAKVVTAKRAKIKAAHEAAKAREAAE